MLLTVLNMRMVCLLICPCLSPNLTHFQNRFLFLGKRDFLNLKIVKFETVLDTHEIGEPESWNEPFRYHRLTISRAFLRRMTWQQYNCRAFLRKRSAFSRKYLLEVSGLPILYHIILWFRLVGIAAVYRPFPCTIILLAMITGVLIGVYKVKNSFLSIRGRLTFRSKEGQVQEAFAGSQWHGPSIRKCLSTC